MCPVTNKIDGYKSSQPLVGSSAKGAKGAKGAAVGKAAGATRAGEAAEASGADQVTLTQSARDLQQVAAAVEKAPVVDAGKVEATRQSIRNGTYSIDAGRIADNILRFEKLLK